MFTFPNTRAILLTAGEQLLSGNIEDIHGNCFEFF